MPQTKAPGNRLLPPNWHGSYSTAWTLLFVVQKAIFIFFGVMLLLPLFLFLSAVTASHAYGQTTPASESSSSTPESTSLPDAPSATAANQPSAHSSKQPRSPFPLPSYGQPLQSMSIGGKFQYFVEPAFGPRALFITAFSSGIRMANPPNHYPPEWHSGAAAYGRLYGDAFARSGAESIGRFTAASLLHEDPRYRRSQSTSPVGRLAHALAFTLVDQTDGGHPTLAVSNFTGAAASGFIGNAYLPTGFDNLTHAGQRSAIAFGGMAGRNVAAEFAPEIGHLLVKIHLPHIPTPPVWWTGDK